MSKVSDFLLGLVLPLAETAGEEQLDIVLDKLAANKPEIYKAIEFGLHAAVTALKPEINPSSKIIAGLVDALDEEVTASAAKHGLDLNVTISFTSAQAPVDSAATTSEAGSDVSDAGKEA